MLLILKLFLVPVIIALVSVIGRKYGQQLSGIIAGLPIILGPILVFLTVENGQAFAEASAKASLLGVISTGVFCTAYSFLAEGKGVLQSMLLAVLSFGVSAYLFSFVSLPAILNLVLVVAGLLLFLKIFPQYEVAGPNYAAGASDILFRMIAAGCLVLVVTELSHYLGTRGSGILSVFPIAGSVLAGFTHHYYGFNSVRRLLKGYLYGLFGLALFSFTFALLVPNFNLIITACVSAIGAILGSITIRSTRFASSLSKTLCA